MAMKRRKFLRSSGLLATSLYTFGFSDFKSRSFSVHSYPTEEKPTGKDVPLLYKDANAPIEDRIDDLIKRMTLEEKVDQMMMNTIARYKDSPNGFGAIATPFTDIQDIARRSAELKRYAREDTELGIPPIQNGECLHGVLAAGATVFPQAIAQGSTWNPALIEKMGIAIAVEASAIGIDQALAPLFDIIRDPRYGRTEECFGEDPFLVGQLGAAFVAGMQGSSGEDAIAPNKVLCTAKHFAGYSQPQAGINLAPVSIGKREMRSIFLKPFKAAVKKAEIAAVMPSYSEVDGVPAHTDKWLLTQILHGQWNFQGYVISDYKGLSMLCDFHKVARDYQDAAIQGIEAGVDMEAPEPAVYTNLVRLVRENKINGSLIDGAVRRILRAKFKGGLFEKKYADPSRLKDSLHTKAHIHLSRQLAEEAVILLKNDDNLLPLDVNSIRSLAVIGPNADQVQYGDYSCTRDNQSGISVLQGIRRFVDGKVKINFAQGCGLTSSDPSGIPGAVAAANSSDAVVLVVGGSSSIISTLNHGKGPGKNEPDMPFTCGEGYDVTNINPIGIQRELIKAVYETGKPVILVMIHGRPWSISWEKQNIPAILEAWYPGEQGGAALANILFGEVNPSGRLAVTIPQSVGHVPIFYDHKPSAKGYYHKPGTPENPGRDYVFSSTEPLFPFGFGLSYTSFEYANMQISKTRFNDNDDLEVRVDIKNVGSRAGKEVVQLYITDEVSSVTTPVMALKGFKKIHLEAGQKRRIRFLLKAEDFGLWNKEMIFVTEPGVFKLHIARAANDIVLSKTVVYTG